MPRASCEQNQKLGEICKEQNGGCAPTENDSCSSSAELGFSQASIISNETRLNDLSFIFSSMLQHMSLRAFELQNSTSFLE